MADQLLVLGLAILLMMMGEPDEAPITTPLLAGAAINVHWTQEKALGAMIHRTRIAPRRQKVEAMILGTTLGMMVDRQAGAIPGETHTKTIPVTTVLHLPEVEVIGTTTLPMVLVPRIGQVTN